MWWDDFLPLVSNFQDNILVHTHQRREKTKILNKIFPLTKICSLRNDRVLLFFSRKLVAVTWCCVSEEGFHHWKILCSLVIRWFSCDQELDLLSLLLHGSLLTHRDHCFKNVLKSVSCMATFKLITSVWETHPWHHCGSVSVEISENGTQCEWCSSRRNQET